MFVHHRTQAFILKQTERGEADKLFTVFTKKFGKLEVLAKALRKMKSKLRAGIPLFSLAEIEFIQGKTFKILTDAILIEDFKNIKEGLERLKITYQVADISDQLIKGQEKDEKIWQLFSGAFKELNNPQLPITSYQLLYYYFFFNLLKILGYSPHLSSCAFCQEKLDSQNASFSFEQRGLLCYSCSKKLKKEGDATIFRVGTEKIELLKTLLEKNFSFLKETEISPEDKKFLEGFSEKYSAFTT